VQGARQQEFPCVGVFNRLCHMVCIQRQPGFENASIVEAYFVGACSTPEFSLLAKERASLARNTFQIRRLTCRADNVCLNIFNCSTEAQVAAISEMCNTTDIWQAPF
jgi:hypothetical protein